MHKDQQQQPPNYRVRGTDRRICVGVKQPPYMTSRGQVDHDRRSPFDRRANWLRELSFDFSNS